MLSSFPNIVKPLLRRLPSNDYPVLNSRLFFEIWLTFVLDSSLMSMRDLFYRLNKSGIKVDISTFSKACKNRQEDLFCHFYVELMNKLKEQGQTDSQMIVPIDSTVITLTSKLFFAQNYHQVKLLNGINIEQGNPTECLIHFGDAHDAHFLDYINSMIPENGVGVMDRGFASWKFLDELSRTNTKFVVRLKNNMKTEFDHNRYRVVWFCDLESRTEFRLATNLEELSKKK
jgi:putative transposase